jgi:hypothetical protein
MSSRGTTDLVVPRLEISSPPDLGDPALTGRRVLQTWVDSSGRLVASAGRDDGSCWMQWPGLGTYSFAETGPVRVTPVRGGLDHQLTDTFVRGVLPVVLLSRGYHAVHASAVADAEGVAVLCATSGTGKSTLALALSRHGLQHWADDTAVYQLTSTAPLVHRLPFHPRIDDAAVAPASGNADGRGPDALPLRRVYFLSRDASRDPDRPLLTPVEPRTRFERLLAHAHPVDMHGPERHRAFIEAVMRVAATVEMAELRFAPSLPALPRLCAVMCADLRGR